MAAGILPKPGSKLGPCPMHCTHVDCKETKARARDKCRFCAKPIGFETRYYRSPMTGDMAHASCLEEAVERNDARAGLF